MAFELVPSFEVFLENESPDIVRIGVLGRGGLGLLEKGDVDLELTLDGAITSFGVVLS